MQIIATEAALSLTPAQLNRIDRTAVVIVDVRGYGEFAQSRMPGAICIPLDELPGRVGEIPPGRPLVCVCAAGRRSEAAARLLASLGREARSLVGGLAAWKSQGYPLWTRPNWALERQVRLAAGILVLSGLGLAHLWTPARLLAWVVGGGLVFAALSDTCIMGAALLKMPWNRPPASSP